MGVDVDRPRHDDLAPHIVGLTGFLLGRRGDDAAVIDEQVGLFVAGMRRIDDASALEADQHRRPSRLSSKTLMRSMVSVTVGLSTLGVMALIMPIPDMDRR